MDEKVKVGVFWVCDDGAKVEIIHDVQLYPRDWVSDFGDEFIIYEKSVRTAWQKLSKTMYNGKYAEYAYSDFPRGRVAFDSEEGVHIVDVDVKLKPKFSAIKSKIAKLFNIENAEYHVDKALKSSKGIFNK